MIETFTALLFTHTLTDFAFQSDRMAHRKAKREITAFASHLAILLGLSAVALLQFSTGFLIALALVFASHLLIDFAKSFAPPTLKSFVFDQAAHLIAYAFIAAWFSDLWAQALWSDHKWIPGVYDLIAGSFITVRAGGFAIERLLTNSGFGQESASAPAGGELIGLLERSLIFILILANQPSAIGFLIVAKVWRFDALSKSDTQLKSEYVIIGTLASFGWALAASYATLALLGHLPPLGILPVPD
ncbi:hypothetical protein B6V73_08890 [Thioclava sp. JM3]|uniref:DUF3307 domain-containing protein n=1 Tax=Thioclava sp. JM3 TaxID=1973004 RepID=UPI000B53B4ED|nr:DUF3307 domain-containing protein [Thioclava sp. JM3]OWY16960.1 hypothetical protein B6V73_08890 [Thioclava sp. JM3]